MSDRERAHRTVCCMTHRFFARTSDIPYLPEDSGDNSTCKANVSTSSIDRFVRHEWRTGRFDLIVSNKKMSNPAHNPAPEFDAQGCITKQPENSQSTSFRRQFTEHKTPPAGAAQEPPLKETEVFPAFPSRRTGHAGDDFRRLELFRLKAFSLARADSDLGP